MALYAGPPVESDSVALVKPDAGEVSAALATADIDEGQKGWFEQAQSLEDLLYFSVALGTKLVGQIFLHDMDPDQHEAMVGYHIFDAEERGGGYGAAALDALCHHALHELGLHRLVIITSLDNSASKRIAEKCDFRSIGPAREGPDLIVYEQLASPADIIPL